MTTQDHNVDRRTFLALLGISGAGSAAFLAGGCDNFDLAHKEATMRALANVLIPTEGPDAPGAVEAGALEVMKTRHFVQPAIALGFIPELPPRLANKTAVLDEVIRDTLVADLDATVAARYFDRKKHFVDLPKAERTAVVAERMQVSPARYLYELVRTACMLAFLSAPVNDIGLRFIGMPPYLDFDAGLHNTGYPDYSYNQVPSVDGRTVWNESIDGDLP